MDKFPKIGVNVFVFKDGKILLGKRIGKTGYGTWCLPGGHFEWGESLLGAAARELEEETSIKSGDLEFLHLVNNPLKETHYVNMGFLAKKWIGVPEVMEPDKFAEWKFFEIENLPEPIFTGHEKLISAFVSKIVFQDNKEKTT